MRQAKYELNMNTKNDYYDDYCSIIKYVQYELNKETEWQKRYLDYAAKLSMNKLSYSKPRNLSPLLKLYTTISGSLDNVKGNNPTLDVRYKGQSVANIEQVCDDGKDNFKLIIPVELINNNAKTFTGYSALNQLNDNVDICVDLDSTTGRIFNKFFTKDHTKQSKNKKEAHPEHTLESALLTELEKTMGGDKYIKYIQPITLLKMRYQFPTPFTASKIYKKAINGEIGENDLSYSKGNGGGIDILARRKRKIVVMELKDEYSNKEKPELAIRQAIVYATFVRELLRYGESQNKDHWYKLFGFNSKLPKKLKIKCAIAMPDVKDPNLFINAGLMELPLADANDKHQDVLSLHCINIVLNDNNKNDIVDLIPDKEF